MKIEALRKLFELHKCTDLIWDVRCTVCGEDVVIHASIFPADLTVEGGAVYSTPAGNFYKCDARKAAELEKKADLLQAAANPVGVETLHCNVSK